MTTLDLLVKVLSAAQTVKWEESRPDGGGVDVLERLVGSVSAVDQRDEQRVSSGSPFEESVGFSRGVRVGDQIAIAGTAPIWPDGEVDPDPLIQARRCWEIVLAALHDLGGTPADAIRTRTYLTSADVEAAAAQAHGEIFADIRPASTMLVVATLLDPRWKIEVELDAVVGRADH
ncbi:MAG: RidA family protein [Ilumatobacteraceae bacterium]